MHEKSSGDREDSAVRLGDAMTRTVYEELRPIAASLLRHSARSTLDPTVVVNEAFLRLAGNDQLRVESRLHLVCLAARAMRFLIADHARQRGSRKRGGDAVRISLSDVGSGVSNAGFDAADVHEALSRLEAEAPRQARVVELRFFGGLTELEIGEALEVSTRTVRNDWRFARAWLRSELGAEAEP